MVVPDPWDTSPTMLRPQTKIHTKITTVVEHLASHHPVHQGATDVSVTGIAMRSQSVEPGDLYAAIAGAQHHGADYIDQALEAGATAVLTDAAGATRLPAHLATIIVDDVRAALGDAAALIYRNIATATPQVYGVTGTNGKTTTTYFVNALLAAMGHTTGLIGTIETRIAGTSVPSDFTTPEAPDLHALIARMRESDVDVAAMEVSSHAMSYHRTTGLRYGVVGFTNLTQDHLDLHGTMDDYFAAKAALFEPERASVPVVTINGGAEPSWGNTLAQRIGHAVTLDLGPAAITPSPDGEATWKITALRPEGLGHVFTLVHESGFSIDTSVGMPGKFNIANAALAAVMVLSGHDQTKWPGIRAVLETSEHAPFSSAVPGRMEVIAESPTVIVDFAHNPDGLTQALHAVNRASQEHDSAAGRTIIVFGATGQRDTSKRPRMGEIAAQYSDVVIVTDDDPHSEDPSVIRRAVYDGALAQAAQQSHPVEVLEIAPRAAALAYAVEIARPQDTILAAGRGHETHQDLAGEPFAIDDRQVLREALVDHGFVTTERASTSDSD